MKAEVKIPDGWEKVDIGDTLKQHDKFLNTYNLTWDDAYDFFPSKITDLHPIIIRKNK